MTMRNEMKNGVINKKSTVYNNGYNSLLLMNLKRLTFYIFNPDFQYENPSGFVATKS